MVGKNARVVCFLSLVLVVSGKLQEHNPRSQDIEWTKDGQKWSFTPENRLVKDLSDLTDGIYTLELAEKRPSCDSVPGTDLECIFVWFSSVF
jgi:hypothetical protein